MFYNKFELISKLLFFFLIGKSNIFIFFLQGKLDFQGSKDYRVTEKGINNCDFEYGRLRKTRLRKMGQENAIGDSCQRKNFKHF